MIRKLQVGKTVSTTQKAVTPSVKSFDWYAGLQFSITNCNYQQTLKENVQTNYLARTCFVYTYC